MGRRKHDEAGILHPAVAAEKFAYRRHPVDPRLAPYVMNFWTVSWHLDEPWTATVLPLPVVNLTVTNTEADVTGIVRRRYERLLQGHGYAVGARFRPGGFHPFLRTSVAELTDTHRPIAELLGRDTTALFAAVADTDDTDERVALLTEFLVGSDPQPDPVVEQVADLVARTSADPSIARASQVAQLAGLPLRTVQRIFAEYVGAGPKWIINRRRILEVAARAGSDVPQDWADLAARLGYADQAHLTREFAATVGMPPAAYSRVQQQASVDRVAAH